MSVVHRSVLGLCVGFALLGARPVQAQDPPGVEKGWRDDPYTRNEPEALERAGYVSVGKRMGWGDDHQTRDIEEILGSVPLIWLETAHFRIGSSLPEYRWDKDDKKKIQAEIKRLKKRLPRAKDKGGTLDRWLRLHLYAQRLEETYAEFSEFLGVTDGDFPEAGAEASTVEPFMGNGPFLGRKGKYLVLLLEKKSNLGRYGQRYGQGLGGGASPLQLGFHDVGSLCFATAQEFFEGRFDNDTALHCHVDWNVIRMLLNGFKDYYHVTPRWLAEGLNHWYSRRISEEYPTLSLMKEPSSKVADQTDWARKVRARVKVGVYPLAAELMRWQPTDVLEFANHTMMWSRVDFLMSLEDDAFARFIHAFKAPIPVEGRSPTLEEVHARQDEAMLAELGFDAAGFDEAWKDWVLKTYPKR